MPWQPRPQSNRRLVPMATDRWTDQLANQNREWCMLQSLCRPSQAREPVDAGVQSSVLPLPLYYYFCCTFVQVIHYFSSVIIALPLYIASQPRPLLPRPVLSCLSDAWWLLMLIQLYYMYVRGISSSMWIILNWQLSVIKIISKIMHYQFLYILARGWCVWAWGFYIIVMHVCVRYAVPGRYGQLAIVCRYAINCSYTWLCMSMYVQSCMHTTAWTKIN